MKSLIEKCFKSVWIPFVLFVFVAILGIVFASFIYPSQELFYLNKTAYDFWKIVSVFTRQVIIGLAGLAVVLSFIYKIKNRMWIALFTSIASFVLFFGVQNYMKKIVQGRFYSFEETDQNIRTDLKQFALMLEDFKSKEGNYPLSIEEITGKGFTYKTMFPVDQNERSLYPEDWPLHYQVSKDRQDYDLRSSGVDMKWGTIDDIVWKSLKGE